MGRYLDKTFAREGVQSDEVKLMNFEEDYFESEETEKERAKGKPVVGRVSRPGSARPLQECVGRSAMSRRLAETDR